ncbi:MAG: DUF3604 domain-containing protein [Pseudomonadales bacterium]|nr:DUF3604 domain-containing protein [Pseudomonadales bacterium]MDP7359172.1 DUF3604 domain-containing protein [Pseudomonadales bacterium]MDP7596119.1 DUF3604 domain-containing protein [Pseudomonadales bacterium]
MKTHTANGKSNTVLLFFIVVALSMQASPATAQESYSPNVYQTYPGNVYWGDTHVHTYLSGDAYTLGTLRTPDDAYRFAKGETIRATGGEEVRLRRSLDFLMVADHAENLGVLPRLVAGDALVPDTKVSRYWQQLIAGLMPLPEILNADSAETFNLGNQTLGQAKGAWQPDYGIDENFRRTVWHEVVAIAEKHNNPGTFTTFAGYEWSGRAPAMIHRNVLFPDGPEQTGQTLPFSRFDSDNVEMLWEHLNTYEDHTGGHVISIPHNSNLSGGQMFKPDNYAGEPLTKAYAQTRARFEPIVEVTQIKGDSETAPWVSPSDEFADFERWGKSPQNAKTGAKKPVSAGMKAKAKTKGKYSTDPKKKVQPKSQTSESGKKQTGKLPQAAAKKPPQDPYDLARQSYARSALKLGLDQQAELSTNPFKFGMIGSTDSHTGLATADEDNFWGKMGLNEPSRYRAVFQSIYGASGYAGVWAHENTRASLFAAFKRREVYATTGPRIMLRFFGGWDYTESDASSPNVAAVGYRKGVPMGGDLTLAANGKAPGFLIRAVKDPQGANLDRVQIIKGWRDSKGKLFENVYDVAWSDERSVGKDGKLQPVGTSVDVASATYHNSIGAAELSVTWTDPDFDATEAAFYYVRAIQIPTPRWTAYDAAYYGLTDLSEQIPLVTQGRAYSSPIWYTP